MSYFCQFRPRARRGTLLQDNGAMFQESFRKVFLELSQSFPELFLIFSWDMASPSVPPLFAPWSLNGCTFFRTQSESRKKGPRYCHTTASNSSPEKKASPWRPLFHETLSLGDTQAFPFLIHCRFISRSFLNGTSFFFNSFRVRFGFSFSFSFVKPRWVEQDSVGYHSDFAQCPCHFVRPAPPPEKGQRFIYTVYIFI